MASEGILCKAGLWALAVCMVLSLHGPVAEAQTNCSSSYVPPWGIALLVLTSILLAALLCSLFCVPFLCKKSCSCCQSGFSFSK
ncbi:hypothetical protein XELAEV_18039240mg [Xenopus laevis]|uniref:Uncharacterized protein n=1 Tax=Xenopus laevis TaxID=8355 RepID=A0A974C7B8_XENLA|nr:hypothetical protein XELAEV_18039240mg [Xenopus laevis]